MGEPPLVPSPIPSFPQPQSSIHPVFFHRDIPHILSSSPAFHSSVPISGSVFDPSGSASGPLAVSPSGTHSIGPPQQVLSGLVSNPSCSAPDPLFEPPSGTQENGSQQAAPGELPPALDGIGPLPGPLAGPLEASQRKMEATSGHLTEKCPFTGKPGLIRKLSPVQQLSREEDPSKLGVPIEEEAVSLPNQIIAANVDTSSPTNAEASDDQDSAATPNATNAKISVTSKTANQVSPLLSLEVGNAVIQANSKSANQINPLLSLPSDIIHNILEKYQLLW
ncbi:hypothetical protein MRB53_023300 [Persea americana]|uniref:Uncharacterized protein n=1 Tax=Persea americana TaxID=3435 RepID=A0ACC2L9E6_PERAE|nr:hypothetical protein MRB53_023300 [Persea americana]